MFFPSGGEHVNIGVFIDDVIFSASDFNLWKEFDISMLSEG